MDEIEIRRMQPSDVGAVAEVESYAYLNGPVAVAVYGGNGEKERKVLEKTRIDLYSNNPQETYVAVDKGKIVGGIRSFPCSGDCFSSFPFSKEEHDYFASQKIEQLSYEE